MAKPDSKQAHRRPGAHRQPITRHPLFPVVVALWFAALLALGSFALSTTLLENLVLAARLDAVVPAAAPPLGATARLALALLLGLLGAATGWVLAKHVTAPKTATAPQVFNVADADLGAPPQWPGVAEASTPSEPAALPEPPVLAEPTVPAPLPILDPASLVAEGVALPAAQIVVEQEPIPAPAPPRTAAQRIADADLAELSHVELVERLAIALQRRENLVDAGAAYAGDRAAPVLHFPDFADRRSARPPLPAAQSRAAPQETEKALREALAQLERISGCA